MSLCPVGFRRANGGAPGGSVMQEPGSVRQEPTSDLRAGGMPWVVYSELYGSCIAAKELRGWRAMEGGLVPGTASDSASIAVPLDLIKLGGGLGVSWSVWVGRNNSPHLQAGTTPTPPHHSRVAKIHPNFRILPFQAFQHLRCKKKLSSCP